MGPAIRYMSHVPYVVPASRNQRDLAAHGFRYSGAADWRKDPAQYLNAAFSHIALGLCFPQFSLATKTCIDILGPTNERSCYAKLVDRMPATCGLPSESDQEFRAYKAGLFGPLDL